MAFSIAFAICVLKILFSLILTYILFLRHNLNTTHTKNNSVFLFCTFHKLSVFVEPTFNPFSSIHLSITHIEHNHLTIPCIYSRSQVIHICDRVASIWRLTWKQLYRMFYRVCLLFLFPLFYRCWLLYWAKLTLHPFSVLRSWSAFVFFKNPNDKKNRSFMCYFWDSI